ALVAGRRRVSLVPRAGETGAWWKHHAHHVAIAAEPGSHRVPQLLELATALGLEPVAELVSPRGATTGAGIPAGAYAVLHPNPFYRFRRWTDAGWRSLAGALAERGLTVVVTGGPVDA